LNKKIAVVLIVVLSIASLCLTLAPKAKADSSDIKILSYSWYVAPATTELTIKGDLIVVGEIQNTGSQIIDKPWVQAIAYDANGTALAGVYGPSYVKDILPQQKAPFYFDFTAESANPAGNYSGTLAWIPFVDHVNATVGYGQVTGDQMYRGVTIAVKTSYTTNNVFSVTGIIQNNGTEISGKVLLVTTFYNASGTAVAANITNYLTQSLAPNDTLQFTATPMDNTASLTNQITGYSLLIQAMPFDNSTTSSPSPTPIASQSPTASTTPTISTTPTSSEQPTQSPQGQQSTSSLDIIYIAIAAAVAIVIIVAVLFFLRKKR
jgi:hypothetical protein